MNAQVLHVNLRGWCSHNAELVARLRLLEHKPALVCVTESWLSCATRHVELEGYVLVHRRDRSTGEQGGGLLIFAESSVQNSVEHVADSTRDERSWVMLHAMQGPVLVGCWYRPPGSSSDSSITRCASEVADLKSGAMGVVLVGDMNVHAVSWLRFSNGTSAAGKQLHQMSRDAGLQQKVKKATRGEYLLDLCLTDMDGVSCRVLEPIADHCVVVASLNMQVTQQSEAKREVWNMADADWVALRDVLLDTDWSCLQELATDEAVRAFTEQVLRVCEQYIPRRIMSEKKTSHPWMNARAVGLVAARCAAAGTAQEREAAKACSEGLLQEYNAWVEKTKQKLLELPRGSKQWWRLSKQLLRSQQPGCSIPALRKEDGCLAQTASEKAETCAKVFRSKFHVPVLEENVYSQLPEAPQSQLAFQTPDVAACEEGLASLDESSATGPDLLPARVLKKCASELAVPVHLLLCKILEEGQWPDLWKQHWIVPLHKRKSVHDAGNYRPINLTSQLSKVLERLVAKCFETFIDEHCLFGHRQFA